MGNNTRDRGKAKKFRGDAYSKWLRNRINRLRKEWEDQHKHSLTSEDSDSYDEAQRLSGQWKEAVAALSSYLKFKS